MISAYGQSSFFAWLNYSLIQSWVTSSNSSSALSFFFFFLIIIKYQLIILLISQILNGGCAFNCGNLNIIFCFIWQNDKKSLYNSACEVFDAMSQWDSAYGEQR